MTVTMGTAGAACPRRRSMNKTIRSLTGLLAAVVLLSGCGSASNGLAASVRPKFSDLDRVVAR